MEMKFGGSRPAAKSAVKPSLGSDPKAGDPLHGRKSNVKFRGWSKIPEFDVPELAVELYAEQACGKTHCAGTFPYPALCDTEKKGWMVWGKLGHKKYYQVDEWEDVVAFWEHVMKNTMTSRMQLEQGMEIDPEITVDTLVFDSSKDLRDWAELYTKGVTNKKSLYSEKGGPVQYSLVYAKLDRIIQETRRSGRNIVFTSRMKDEYVNNEKTGRLIRDGYNKAPYQFDLILRLQRGIHNSKGRQLYPKKIFGRVEKVGWMHASIWPPYVIGNALGITYDDIVNELVKGEGTTLDIDEWIEQVVKPKMDALGVSP